MTIENPLAPETPTDAAAAPAPELTADEQALASMDEGFAAAVEPKEPEAPTAEAPKAEPEGGQPPGTVAKAKPDDAKPADPPKPEPDAAIEKEAADLGLKGKANERFREMAAEIKTLAPVKEALDKAGIKDLAELPQIVEQATFGRELYQQVQDTGANAEQYGQALDYLAFVNKANGGDLKAAEVCFNMMQEELGNLAKLLGREVPGIHDPLSDHPDLLAKVKESDLSRADALEIARARNAVALTEAGRKAAETKQTQTKEQEAALTQATTDLNTLGAELAAIDPHFQAKAPTLVAQLKVIKDSLPPGQWVAKARALYATIPNPAPAVTPTPTPTPTRVQPGPLRGTALHGNLMPQTDDPMEALEQAFNT